MKTPDALNAVLRNINITDKQEVLEVDTAIVDGEVLMRDRILTHVDKEALYMELEGELDRPLTNEEQKKR